MRYVLDYLSGASNSIEKLSRHLQQRILARLEGLSSNPRPAGSIKLTGQGAHRIESVTTKSSTPSTTNGSSCS